MTVEAIDATLEEFWVGQALASVRDLLDGATLGDCFCGDDDDVECMPEAGWVAEERRREPRRWPGVGLDEAGLAVWGSGWFEIGITTDDRLVGAGSGELMGVINAPGILPLNYGGLAPPSAAPAVVPEPRTVAERISRQLAAAPVAPELPRMALRTLVPPPRDPAPVWSRRRGLAMGGRRGER